MKQCDKTKDQLINELERLSQRICELETAEVRRQQDEERLKEREERIRFITDAVPVLISYVEPDGRYAFVNKTYQKWWGVPVEEIEGHPVAEALGGTDYQSIAEHVESALSGTQVRYEATVTYPDLRTRHVECVYVPHFGRQGEVKGFVALITDITHGKQAEEALRKAKDELERTVWERTAELKTLNEELLREIAERKAAEEVIRESGKRFRNVFEQGPLGIAIVGLDYRWIAVNATLCEMVGYTEDELANIKFVDITHPDDIEVNLGYAEKLARGELPSYKMEKRYVRKNGEVLWINLTGSIVRDDEGKPLYFLSMIEDITERKRAEQALRESEEQYRAVFDNAGIGINVVDRVTRRLTQANPALLNMLGYSEEELQQLIHLDITYPEDREITKQRLDSLMEGALDSFELEKRYIKKDGSIIWGHLSVSTIRDAEGNPRAAVGMIADITERKKAGDAIRKSEERLELALKGADLGLWDWDLRTAQPTWNHRAIEILGYSTKEAEYTFKGFKRLVHPEDWPLVSEVLNSHLEGRLSSFHVECRFRCKSGEWKWVLSQGKVVEYDEHGKPLRMTGTILDITERKCAELERADLRAQLLQAQKMEAIGTLAGGIAHDFNNLLTVILGYSELIISEKKEGDREYEDLKKIIHAARTAGDVVQQILAFSRKTETKPRPINLNKQVEQLKKLLSRLIPKTIEVEISLDSGLPTVNADPAQIEQVLMNLAVNARDAMPNGGRLLIETQTVLLDQKYCRFHIEASQGPHALLVVSDTGVGIDKSTMQRIFEPFYTTKKPSQGTGLGLAMVYGIVKSHGGHITCESEPGRGATFRIYVPAHDVEGVTDVTVSGEFSVLGEGTILLVDDEEFVRQLGQRILEKTGYNVITATNGQEAVEVYKEKGNQISLVILDLIMPVMDGNQCLTEILRIDPGAKVLIASGYSPDGTIRETLEGGANGFVGKPYDLKQLLRTVRDALNEK